MADDDAVSSAPKFHKDRSSYGAALQGWLTRTVPGATDVEITDLEIPVATGFSNETVLFTTHRGRPGVRVRPARFVGRIEPGDGGLFPSQTPTASVSVEVQQRAMATVAAHGVAPVPAVVGFESDPSVLGQPFFVMEFVAGVVPGDQPRYSAGRLPGRRGHPCRPPSDGRVRPGGDGRHPQHRVGAGRSGMARHQRWRPTHHSAPTRRCTAPTSPTSWPGVTTPCCGRPRLARGQRSSRRPGRALLGRCPTRQHHLGRLHACRRGRLGGLRGLPHRGRSRLVADVRPHVVRRPRRRAARGFPDP